MHPDVSCLVISRPSFRYTVDWARYVYSSIIQVYSRLSQKYLLVHHLGTQPTEPDMFTRPSFRYTVDWARNVYSSIIKVYSRLSQKCLLVHHSGIQSTEPEMFTRPSFRYTANWARNVYSSIIQVYSRLSQTRFMLYIDSCDIYAKFGNFLLETHTTRGVCQFNPATINEVGVNFS